MNLQSKRPSKKNQQRVAFYNQGCRLNQSETSLLERQFSQASYHIVPLAEGADVVIVNTCTVTENGDADTRRLVNKINRLNPKSKIALIGCQSQILKDKLLQLPNVHWVVGNQQKMSLLSIFESSNDHAPTVIVDKIKREPFKVDAIEGPDPHHTRVNLKIQDGCDFYCAFCVIPFARGPARSRNFDDIIMEAQRLSEAGHQELVLTGVNIGTYHSDGKSFLDIIDALEKLEKIARIRISSIEPTTIPMELFDRMSESSKLCRYLHLPIQSASDAILKRMSRKYTLAEYDTFLARVCQRVPNIGLGTDVIVGFPGETDALFSETETYLRESPIQYFHVFSYSERQFARSKKLDGSVDTRVIRERSQILRDLSKRKRMAHGVSQLGQRVPVLFEQKKHGVWWGYTEQFSRVKMVSEENLNNVIVDVTLTNAASDGLLGERH